MCPLAELPGKPLAVLPTFPAAVTAVAFAPTLDGGCAGGAAEHASGAGSGAEQPRCCLAVGLESGAVEVWAVAMAGGGSEAPSVTGAATLLPAWKASLPAVIPHARRCAAHCQRLPWHLD